MNIQQMPQNQTNFKAWASNPLLLKGLYKENESSKFIQIFVENVIKKSPEIDQFVKNHQNVRLQLDAHIDKNGNVHSVMTLLYDKLATRRLEKFVNKIFNSNKLHPQPNKISIDAVSHVTDYANIASSQYKLLHCMEEHTCQINPNSDLSKDISESGKSFLKLLHDADSSIPTNLKHDFN